MARPTARVLAVLELLQTHRRMTGAELAARLEVDGRTVRRYVALLQDIGIPLTAERGRDGAYMLVAGFKLPPMMFTNDEALALSVGLVAARGLGLASAVTAASSAQAKLERVMPDALQRRARAVDETVTLELSRPTAPADNAALAALTARRAVARPRPPALPPARGRDHRARVRRVRPRVPRRPLVRRRLVPPAARAALVPSRPRRGRAAA